MVEVVIFVSVLGLFFIYASSVVIASIRNMKVSEHKILATKYAEELMEWLKSQKEINWDDFVSMADNKTYCFNDNINLTDVFKGKASGSCVAPNDYTGITGTTPLIFKREATLAQEGSPVEQVNVSVKVEWKELGNTYQVPLYSVLTLWE